MNGRWQSVGICWSIGCGCVSPIYGGGGPLSGVWDVLGGLGHILAPLGQLIFNQFRA
jgi:hypothetical protein